MKKLVFSLAVYGSALALPASFHAQVPHAPVKLVSPIQDKNFYLLSLMERTPAIEQAMRQDPELAQIEREERKRIMQCETAHDGDPDCMVDAAFFSDAAIDRISERLIYFYRTNQAMRQAVAGPMRSSGFFERYASGTSQALLVHAWTDAAHGIDQILSTYGKGAASRYPEIDSASFDMRSKAGCELLHRFGNSTAGQSSELYFQPSLRLALLLLNANHRDEASRLEPLDAGENAAAIRRLRTVRWAQYRYTAIVVPGRGPDEAGVSLAPEARVRIELAAKNYKAGLAPVILVSGGFVHPSQTQFCEAIEMKRALVASFGIPADAIVVDPYARHTTTNLRNAARLIYRYGIPFDSPALITTDAEHSAYIASAEFSTRNEEQLGYLPYRFLKRVSAVDLAFLPAIDALQLDSRDPLDP